MYTTIFFFRDDTDVPDSPSFGCEDRTCGPTYLTSSSVWLLMQEIFSVKDNSISDDCRWVFYIMIRRHT